MAVLLAAVDAGLGGCVLGTFRGEEELAAELWACPKAGVSSAPSSLGHPDGGDHRRASLDRPAPADEARIHHGVW